MAAGRLFDLGVRQRNVGAIRKAYAVTRHGDKILSRGCCLRG
jgi:hypothetical protein